VAQRIEEIQALIKSCNLSLYKTIRKILGKITLKTATAASQKWTLSRDSGLKETSVETIFEMAALSRKIAKSGFASLFDFYAGAS